MTSSTAFLREFVFEFPEQHKYIFFTHFFNTATYSAVYFSHHQVEYWSIERQKGKGPVLTNSGYKFVSMRLTTQQAKDIYHYKDIRESYIKQTGVTANCV